MTDDHDRDQLIAMEAVDPILSLLYGITEDAVSFYFSDAYSDAARADHDDRAMASCIYSHAEKSMLRASDEIRGLHPINLRGFFVLNYHDRVLLRFKKVKPNGKHRNYQTKQQQDYDDQMLFPEFPEAARRLTVGYHLDDLQSSLERIMIARPIGRNIFWTAQVMMIEESIKWEDITPQRFVGTRHSDFDAQRARQHRGW